MIRLLLDQGPAPRAAEILSQRGFDAVHVMSIGLDCAEDAAILEKARADQRTCVTLDHDFHTHLAIARDGSPSVILIRAEGLDAIRQADLIQAVCDQCAVVLSEGAAVSTDRKTIRVRRLPLR